MHREGERKRRERENSSTRPERQEGCCLCRLFGFMFSSNFVQLRERYREDGEDSYRIINETRQMVRVRASRTRGMVRTRTRKKGTKP